MTTATATEKHLAEIIRGLKELDPRTATNEVTTAGEKWADQDAAASSYEESRKSMLAKITLEYMAGGVSSSSGTTKSMPVNQAEIRALSDPRYEQHLELMVQARKEANRCRVRYDMGKMRLELMRTMQATLRAESRYINQT